MAATASAEAPGPAEGWRFELQPYLWVPMQVTGDATVPAIRFGGRVF